MRSFLIAILGLLLLALSTPTELIEWQSSVEEITDMYTFTISITQFISYRKAKSRLAELDWNSDGCSSSPKNPFGFNFQNSCYRHDFGYRYFKKPSCFTEANKARIDQNFETDMFVQCKNEFFQSACEALATVYYEAVKVFGRNGQLKNLIARTVQTAVENVEIRSGGYVQASGE